MPDGSGMATGRTIIVLARVSHADREAAARGEAPQADFDVLARLIRARIVTGADFNAGKAGPIAASLGKSAGWAAVFAALDARSEADDIYLPSEDLAFRLVPLLQLAGWRGRVHVVVHDCSSWRRTLFLRLLGRRTIATFLTDTSAQAAVLTERAGIPPEKVRVYVNPVDADFFNPETAATADGDYVFACGLENRDYATLEAAARLSARRFRVQASGYFPNRSGARSDLPQNYELSKVRVPYTGLRDLYAGARIVVVPLNDVPYAAGVTGLLEAMALSKPVIVTASQGIRDYTGVPSLVVVPADDPARIAEEIERLWDAPELRHELGRANLAWARAHGHVESYGVWAAAQMGLPVARLLHAAG